MNNRIEIYIEEFKKHYRYSPTQLGKIERIENDILKLEKENENLKEQNNDLRKIYRNTYNKLFENGNDELAYYFQAQIDDCPTFYVEPIIDYHKEWLEYKQRNEKAYNYLNKFIPNEYGVLLTERQWEYVKKILGGDEE